MWFGIFSFRIFVSKIWVWGFLFCEPNLLGFLGVLLLGFSDLLILFLGFVGFFIQIGLLDLGIHLDSKKITLYSTICDSRFVQIFGFVILGRGP